MKLGVSFGAFAPTIRDQLAEQGVEVYKTRRMDDACTCSQMDAEAVNRLRIRGVITPSEAERANKRILKSLLRAISDSAAYPSAVSDVDE